MDEKILSSLSILCYVVPEVQEGCIQVIQVDESLWDMWISKPIKEKTSIKSIVRVCTGFSILDLPGQSYLTTFFSPKN